MAVLSSKLPSIPEYFKQFVDSTVDLEVTPSIPCPFHKETHGKSFSYSKALGIWRCFGACHSGGDVIALHKLNKHFKSREEAASSLYKIYGVTFTEELESLMEDRKVEPDLTDAHRRRVYSAALRVAKTPDDYDDLDYILSKYPFDVKELEVFCSSRGALVSAD